MLLLVGSHADQKGVDGLPTRVNRVRSTPVLQTRRLISTLEMLILSAELH